MLLTLVYNHEWTEQAEAGHGNRRWCGTHHPRLRHTARQNGVPRSQARYDTWYGFVNTFLYKFSDTLTGVWRSEVFWDTNGAHRAIWWATVTTR